MRAGAPRRAAAGPLHRHLPITASSPLVALTAASASARRVLKDRAGDVGGFFSMGFIGFFVKLIFIPINNIIVGMG